jgi:hypothetical protein
MLTAIDVQHRRRRRPPPSMKQLYQEYVLQRIEAYKNSLSRDQLLRLGDEAIAEMRASAEEQFVLTEIMALESVDRLIANQLRLQSFNRWRKKWINLRRAQQRPAHWQISPKHPVVSMLERLEPGDHVVVFGTGLERLPCLLAAHDVSVTYLADCMKTVERLESRMVVETLGTEFAAYVTLTGWLPDFTQIDLLVLDPAGLSGLAPALRDELVRELQVRTSPCGIHLHATSTLGTPAAAFAGLYESEEWEVDLDQNGSRANYWSRRLR